jgi:hypothetical protein
MTCAGADRFGFGVGPPAVPSKIRRDFAGAGVIALAKLEPEAIQPSPPAKVPRRVKLGIIGIALSTNHPPKTAHSALGTIGKICR